MNRTPRSPPRSVGTGAPVPPAHEPKATARGRASGSARIWAGVVARVDIRPEERSGATAAFLTLFGLVMAHEQLETARDTIFLIRFSAAQLPYVYLTLAVLAAAGLLST